MPVEHSSGAVVFYRENGSVEFLLLRRGPTYWDLPKGSIDEGEDELATAEREIKEETGLTDVKFVPDFKEKISYFYKREGQTIYKEVIFFLAEAKTKDVKISNEHNDFGWFEYEEAVKKVKSKELIEKVNKFLNSKSKT